MVQFSNLKAFATLKPLASLALLALTPLVFASCQSLPSEPPVVDSVSFAVRDGLGKRLGRATLTDAGKDGVRLDLKAIGISEGLHGIHFHGKARCMAPDFKSAGGHINAKGHKHGLKNPHGPDNADMDNLIADKNEVVFYSFLNSRVTLRKRDDRPALLDTDGSALVIHAYPDDQITQPIGGAGERIACAEIKA